MPELPEVETVVRTLRPAIIGRRIINAEFTGLRVLIGSAGKTAKALIGRKIVAVERHGKFIAIRLDHGYLVVHLGMTGRLLIRNSARTGRTREPGDIVETLSVAGRAARALTDGALSKWTHAIFTLDSGSLLYEDPRQFGRIEYGDELPARVATLGPEPLEVTLEEFGRRLKLRRSPVKAVLLNQAVVRGVGNIYADEALFRAGVHPKRVAASLRADRVARVYRAMREVLEEAIESRGSSISNYVDAEGNRGSFQNAHRVYQRTGEPCVNCGAGIKRILVGQRGTHFCARCQK